MEGPVGQSVRCQHKLERRFCYLKQYCLQTLYVLSISVTLLWAIAGVILSAVLGDSWRYTECCFGR
jgi:hypothetical protein